MTTTLARPAPAGRASLSREGTVAVAVAAAAVLSALAAVLLLTARSAWGLPGLESTWVDVAAAVSVPVMGALVLAGGSGNRVLGRLLLGIGVAAAVSVLSAAIAGTATSPGPLALAAVEVHAWAWVPGFVPLFTLVPLLYPDGRLPSPRWWPAAALALAGTVLLTVAVGLYPEPFRGRIEIDKPWTAQAVAEPLGPAGGALLVASVVTAVAALAVRWRRSSPLVRRQIAVLAGAVGVLVLQLLLQPALPAAARGATQAVAVALVPVAMGVAVTRHRLFDLDLAVSRALLALSLAACLAGAYLTLFLLLRALLPGQEGLATGAAAAVTGLLVQPLGARLARGAERLLYGDRSDPYAVLGRLSAALGGGLSADEVPDAVCAAVVDALRLTSATLTVDAAAGGRPAGRAGEPRGPVTRVELRHRGALVGELAVTPREGERDLDQRDRDLLEVVAGQVAPAVASARLYAELRRSREALVAAREEERRRLRRDLHDGVGAALSGVLLQVESARELVGDPTAQRLLDGAAAAVAEAVRDVRHVTDDLRPPALDDLGLPASLAGLAERARTPGREVTARVAELPELPAAVEVACYRIAAEALANVTKHSGASAVTLCAAVDTVERALVLEVADDGRGLPAVVPDRGLGLGSMQRRAEEVGGRCVIEPAAPGGGTRVRAWLPLEEV
jgi:signal transduction histidine kinase